jgi:hypothetical protein
LNYILSFSIVDLEAVFLAEKNDEFTFDISHRRARKIIWNPVVRPPNMMMIDVIMDITLRRRIIS